VLETRVPAHTGWQYDLGTISTSRYPRGRHGGNRDAHQGPTHRLAELLTEEAFTRRRSDSPWQGIILAELLRRSWPHDRLLAHSKTLICFRARRDNLLDVAQVEPKTVLWTRK